MVDEASVDADDKGEMEWGESVHRFIFLSVPVGARH
jgi:hypothetical protein